MRALAAIRTNKWTEEEERLLAALHPVFGEDIAVVFHDRSPSLAPPLPVVDLNGEWVSRKNLALVPDWGWRCGDYFYYALRQAHPDYDYYWLIEPDVHFTSSPQDFFSAFSTLSEDALGYQLGPFQTTNRFTRGLPELAHYRAIFALTRFSGEALDRLFALRRKMALNPVSVRDYPNDEIFCFSHVAADQGLQWGRLEDRAASWFEGAHFATDPDLLFDYVTKAMPAGKVLHPVRSKAAYKRALSGRLGANTGLLMNIREAIDYFDDDDVDDVAQQTASHVRGAINELRARRAVRHKRQERLGKL